MPTHYVFVDYENVQPSNSDLAVLDLQHFRVVVFVGADQAKLSTNIVLTLQRLGPRGGWLQITGQGKNALDFHIAFYLGRLAEQDRTACFHIITKDTGYDPLIQHLRQRKIHVTRSSTLSDLPPLKAYLRKFSKDHWQQVADALDRRKATRPGTLKTLASTIDAISQKQWKPAEIAALVKRLESEKYFTIDGDKILYKQAT